LLQYSFAPRLYIFNAFLQSVIGLYDYARLTGSARARRIYEQIEPEARREIPSSDVGDWSLYSYRGRESTGEYHELLREFLQSLCDRLRTDFWCNYARRYRSYQRDPAVIDLRGPAEATRNQVTSVSFWLSKLSVVEVSITKDGRSSLHRLLTLRRGAHVVAWRPRGVGTYSVSLGAKELRTGRALRSRDSGTVEVSP
jgi:hypothetical protein